MLSVLFKDITDVEEGTRQRKLLGIVEQAMQLSSILSQQNPEVRFSFLNDLPEAFRLKSPRFTPHLELNLGGDDEDDEVEDPKVLALIGRPVDMVVEPSIARFGDKFGNDYERGKVLRRGVVWMVKDEHLSDDPLAHQDLMASNDILTKVRSPVETPTCNGNTEKENTRKRAPSSIGTEHAAHENEEDTIVVASSHPPPPRDLRKDCPLARKQPKLNQSKDSRQEGTSCQSTYPSKTTNRMATTSSCGQKRTFDRATVSSALDTHSFNSVSSLTEPSSETELGVQVTENNFKSTEGYLKCGSKKEERVASPNTSPGPKISRGRQRKRKNRETKPETEPSGGISVDIPPWSKKVVSLPFPLTPRASPMKHAALVVDTPPEKTATQVRTNTVHSDIPGGPKPEIQRAHHHRCHRALERRN